MPMHICILNFINQGQSIPTHHFRDWKMNRRFRGLPHCIFQLNSSSFLKTWPLLETLGGWRNWWLAGGQPRWAWNTIKVAWNIAETCRRNDPTTNQSAVEERSVWSSQSKCFLPAWFFWERKSHVRSNLIQMPQGLYLITNFCQVVVLEKTSILSIWLGHKTLKGNTRFTKTLLY